MSIISWHYCSVKVTENSLPLGLLNRINNHWNWSCLDIFILVKYVRTIIDIQAINDMYIGIDKKK